MASETQHDAVVAKAVAMCVLFATSMALGTIPIKLSQWFHWKGEAKNNRYVQMLLCLGGGVLLCTTFLHLLPEVAENIADLKDFPDIGLPVAELLMCIGFFIMYFVEECVHVYLHKREKHDLVRRSISISRAKLELSDSSSSSSIEDGTFAKHAHEHDHSHGHNHGHSHGHSHEGHSHMTAVTQSSTTVATLRGLLVVLALSIHELFEGLAVGLEDSASTVWYMFGAVAAHKLVIAFCIGVELVTSDMKNFLVILYVFMFAVVSPLGIGIGIAVSGQGASSTAVPSVILQGLASGTLLYVVFFEILSSDRKSGLRNYLSVLVGFLVMLGITMIESD